MQHTIVFILSPGHSGSTLVDLMVGSHPNCSSLGEFINIAKLAKGDRPVCSVCGVTCSVWEEFARSVVAPRFHDAAFGVFDVRCLVDSSKDIGWIKDSLTNNAAEVKILRVMRQSTGCFLNSKRKNGIIKKDVVLEWAFYSRKIESFLSTIPAEKQFTVKYEDLCADLERELRRICAFLNLDYREGMADFWTVHHHCIHGNAKPLALVQLYHKLVRLEQLRPELQTFIRSNGFAVKLDRRYETKLSATDKEVILEYGGWLDRLYGYDVDPHDMRGRPHIAYWAYLIKRKLKGLRRRMRIP